MLRPYPPLEAYRRDLARLEGAAFGLDDGRWVAAATLLHRYTELSSADRREIGSRLVAHLALESELTFFAAGLQFGSEIEQAGALHLATSWLALLEQTVPDDRTLDLGRVRAARARVARRLGDVEAARELYAHVEYLGESRAEPELTARAWIGYGNIAMERGNNPEGRRWYEAAALVADDTGCREESSLAHQGLMVVFAKTGDNERALVEGWHAYRASAADAERSAELLTNLSQLLYDEGRFAVALRGFGAAVSRATQPRILLGALGGAASCAGMLRRAHVIHAAAARIERLARTAWAHPVAVAYLELSDAFAMVGITERATEYRRRALRLAEENSNHEVAYRASEPPAERAVAADPTPTLGTTAMQVIGQIDSLDAPRDLTVVG